MSLVGLHVAPIVLGAFPRNPQDLKDSWRVVMPQMHDEIECVQIGTEYILSLGAHDTHANLLLSVSHAGSIQDIRQIENLISYLFDAPCMLTFPRNKRTSAAYYKGLKSFFHLIGHRTYTNTYTVEHHLSEIWDTAGTLVSDGYIRLLPGNRILDPQKRCWSCERPADMRFNRAIAVYRQALISPEPQGMILNYWRTLEAVSTKSQRYAIACSLINHRLKAVRALDPYNTKRSRSKPFNLMAKYRRHVLKYFNDLVTTHGSPMQVIDHLYMNRRNPSAHADHSILDIAGSITLLSLYEDALLMKYICRCAVEEYWKSL